MGGLLSWLLSLPPRGEGKIFQLCGARFLLALAAVEFFELLLDASGKDEGVGALAGSE